MKKIIILLLISVLSLFCDSVLLKDKIITLETEGTSIIGDGITISDAKTFAINYAKQAALEMVGTYLESNTTVLNYVVEKDEIKTFTGSVLKAEILKEEKCMLDNNFALKVVVRSAIDTDLLNKRIEDVRKDSQLEKQLAGERKRVEELTRQVAELQKGSNATEEEVRKVSDGLTASDRLVKGNEAHNLKEYKRALSEFNKAIELDPKYAFAYNNRGVAYYDLKDYNMAIQDYDKAIEIDPRSSSAYCNRGLSYYGLKDYKRAISEFNKAIELDPDYSSAYTARGLVYYESNDYNMALQDYNKAIELDPRSVTAYSNRGLSYAALKDYNKAISDYNKVNELDPKHAAGYYNRGIAYYNLQDYNKSSDDFNEYLRLAGNSYGDAEHIRKFIIQMGYEPKY
jgi:tetratricopeptide (TPR) repeat protein